MMFFMGIIRIINMIRFIINIKNNGIRITMIRISTSFWMFGTNTYFFNTITYFSYFLFNFIGSINCFYQIFS